MSYQVLARKWRPKKFSEVVGQPHIVQALVNGLDSDRLHHAFLLTGTRGVGKTTIARILAKCLNCDQGVTSEPCGECSACVDIDEGRFVDLLEVDAASKTKVDDTREMMDNVQYAPTRGRYKVYLIDEVHMLSKHSFNALLKTLEEPPPHVKFVLATTDPQMMPVTILSRCLRFNLKHIDSQAIAGYLAEVTASESIESDDEALLALAHAAEGSMRDALSLLDQAIAHGGGEVRADDVQSMLGTLDQQHLESILGALADAEAPAVLEEIQRLSVLAVDFDRLLASLAESFHRMSLLKLAPGLEAETSPRQQMLQNLSSRFSAADLQLYYQVAVQGRAELDMAPDHRTGAEMTLLRMLAFRPADAGAPADHQDSPASAASGSSGRTSAKVQKSPSSDAASPDRRTEQRDANSRTMDSSTGKPTTAAEPVNGPSAIREPQPAGDTPAAPSPNRSGETGEAAVSGSLEDSDWSELVQQLPLTPPVRELARNLQLKQQKAGRWAFQLARSAAHLDSGARREKLVAALEQVNGAPQTLKIEVTDTTTDTIAAQERAHSDARQQQAEQAIDADPAVQALKQKFDARVIPGSIRPQGEQS